jgi:hypothetical protein
MNTAWVEGADVLSSLLDIGVFSGGYPDCLDKCLAISATRAVAYIAKFGRRCPMLRKSLEIRVVV